MTSRFGLLALLMVCAAAGAQTTDGGLKLRMSEIELGAGVERLSGNRPDWRSVSVEGAHHIAERQTVYGGLRMIERFGLHDSEQWIGYYHPLDANWTALVEGSVSEAHRVLPGYSVFGQLSRNLGGGWILSAGLRHSEYTQSGVNIAVLGVERYWGNWRGAYTLYSGRPEGAPAGNAHRFQLNYYYGERNNVGVSLTTGREVENVGPPLGIRSTEVRNLTVSGRHWVLPAWGLSWDLTTHQQGDLYRRQGFRLGLRHRF